MLFSIIKFTIISFILIAVIHYLYLFFKDNLTIPKTKDLVNRPNDKYNDILNTIKKSTTVNTDSSSSMKNELKDYLKQQMKNVKQPAEFTNESFNYSNF